jgi:hypothetical protein
MQVIGDKSKTHFNSYEPTNKKQFPQVTFKPNDKDEYKTLTITNWGYTNIKGAKVCSDVQKVFRAFKTLIREHNIQNMIKFDNQSKRIIPKIKGGCRKGSTEVNAIGTCPDGFIPRLNKSNKICCIKKELTKSLAFKIIKEFENSKMVIPAGFVNKLKSLTNTKVKKIKECLNGKVRDPDTKRCVLKQKSPEAPRNEYRKYVAPGVKWANIENNSEIKTVVKNKVCQKGKDMNPVTKRCVKPKANKEKVNKVCEEGKVLNPITKRCVKPKVNKEKSNKVCEEGKVLNPITKRCVKVKEAKPKAKAFNCMTMKKDALQTMARSLGSGLVIKSSKKALCDDIKRLLKEIP